KEAIEPKEPKTVAKKPRRRTPGIVTWIVLLLCAAGIAYLHVKAPDLDHAIVNVATLLLGFIATMTLMAWFCFRSAYPPLIRLLVPLACLGLLITVVLIFRIDETRGNMIPVFRYRWLPKADKLLDKAPELSESATVDLSTTTDDDFPG